MKRICIITAILLFISNTFLILFIPRIQSEGWSGDIRLTCTENTSAAPTIAVWENNVHVVWAEEGWAKYRQLWYVNSNDGENAWNTPMCLSSSMYTRVNGPKVAVNGSNIHVIWEESLDLTIHYIHSTDNGNSWDAERILTPRVYHLTDNWDIAVFESNLHVIYMDYNSTLSYIRSTNNGITWSKPHVISATYMRSTHTAIAVNENNVHVVWEDFHFAQTELFYIKSEDDGLTWGNIINITCSPLSSNRYVDMDIDNGCIYVVFGNEENTRQLYFCYSEDNGVTWVRNIKLTNSTEDIFYPVIGTENSRIFVAWKQQYSGIFYKYSNDRGATWSSNTLLTVNTSYNVWPEIDSNNNAFHFVWMSDRDGNMEIYYKRYKIPSSIINATLDIDPDTLNLKSKGRWITTYIELPDGYDVNDINISTILLEDIIFAEKHPSEIGDYDNDGIPDLMVKFDRSEVEDILDINESISLTVSGGFFDDNTFEGSDAIRVINPP
jgi:hypothetical protein